MNRRGRIPGPIQKNLSVGNLDNLQNDNISRWISLDPTSSGWTAADPGSTGTVNALTTSGDGVRVQLELDNNAERWNQTSQNGKRYYRKIEGPNGPLTFADKFSIEFLVWRHAVGANSGSGNQDGSGVVVGIADASCTTDTSDVEWIGVGCYNNIASNEAVRVQTGGDTAITTETEQNCRRVYCWIGPAIDDGDADGNPMIHKTAVYNLDANNRVLDSADPTKQVHEYVGTDPVYVFFCPTFYSGSAPGGATDTDTTWKIWYRVNFAPDGFLPTYVAGDSPSTG